MVYAEAPNEHAFAKYLMNESLGCNTESGDVYENEIAFTRNGSDTIEFREPFGENRSTHP
jgi:hypothetical protein